MNKRTFLKQATLGTLGTFPFLDQISQLIEQYEGKSNLAENEDFWGKIRSDYLLKPDYINLENGFYCMIPQPTLERLVDHIREVNYQASYYMRTVQWDNKNKIAARLAEMAGCSEEELCITRNTTESLDLIIAGFPWKEGDEAIMANQDYGAMLNHFKMVEQRFGIKRKVIDVPMHPANDEEVVQAYANAITPNTKLIMVCHIVNITGHILPIRKICDMAHARGVEVMVDGAHAFGQFQFSIDDLDCDYYGTSLHKWLSAPLGAGFLYVRKEHIDKIWPLLAEGKTEPGDIRRLNHIGTHPVHNDLAIGDAIDFHNAIGGKRKEDRLRYLQNYWIDKARELDHVVINTPEDKARSCGIGNVGIKGMKPAEMAKTLLDEHQIWTVAIDGQGVHGCRICPNVYTSTAELDHFVEALRKMG
ncbi:aminotransferase class V-fold PLP-dependent enzyme [Algoriphagus sediminis]|uniref:Aminotransferase class V-fold PLP-dependent enzyme n=1 Tax=Algoriphagus sediminis TaxID=3057113 RepID=A0ABT7YA76_9BACT|nr:aminotransferase class V-fold PLP-dependent enzyme [Algoriphagus sediminis]MDN3203433.1 aminotransferase class V-fold PLP-dependent enzyme [Algoriphagus sediminis]